MKTIQPIKIWSDGKLIDATYLTMYISYDDLLTTAVFYYTLLSDTQFALAQGKVDMTGIDYENWDDSNNGAYLYVANVLNLTITGDYVPPVSDTQPIV